MNQATLETAPAFLAGKDLAFANDENTPARPGLDQSFAGKIGIRARDGIGMSDQFFGQGANTGELVIDFHLPVATASRTWSVICL